MTPEGQENMEHLCKRILEEKEPKEFMKLVDELDEMLQVNCGPKTIVSAKLRAASI